MKYLNLFALLLLVLSSCGTSMEVFSDHDKDLDIARYKTFSWETLKKIEDKGMNPLYYNELNDKRIKAAVDSEMTLQHFNKVDNNAELEIHYHIVVEDKTGAYADNSGSQYHVIGNRTRITNYQYRQGTLIIDLMDVKTKALVWRGWATDVVSNAARKDPEQAINKAVKKIFTVFPKPGAIR